MRALVVYESMFGCTQQVARAVAEGLATHLDTTVVEVSVAPAQLPSDIDLLVVAAPTHVRGLSRPWTRVAAAKQTSSPLVSAGVGLREWLATVEVPAAARSRCAAVAVDTRLDTHWPSGSAARRAQARMSRKGLRLSTAPQSFYVKGAPGELLSGERSRARAWGARLAQQTVHEAHARSSEPHHTVTWS